jgi:Protein of unknown function (DUF1186)
MALPLSIQRLKIAMTDTAYSFPVNQLLTYCDCREIEFNKWPNYPEELGITSEHIPELIRMALDETWDEEDADETVECWANIHAFRTLGQLKAEAAIEPLLSLLEKEDNDWVTDDLPVVYGMIGATAIPALSEYLANPQNKMFARISASTSLERIAVNYPETRAECVAIISKELEKFTENHPEFNDFLVGTLIDLKAVESAPLIEQAFAADCIATLMNGDWDDVQVDLGLKSADELPRRERGWFYEVPAPSGFMETSSKFSQKSKANKKAKRKQADKSRKQNRKKK